MAERDPDVSNVLPGEIRYCPLLGSFPPHWFVGKYVKTTFRVRPRGREHMWVKVTGHRRGKLVGWLANHPTHDCGVKYGDAVSVSLARIINVLSRERA